LVPIAYMMHIFSLRGLLTKRELNLNKVMTQISNDITKRETLLRNQF